VHSNWLPLPRVDVQACFIGHSFGSIVVSWLVTNVPECVGSILLLDPVSLMLQEPDVAHNFLYRSTDQGSLVQAFFKYFVATELHVRTILRHLDERDAFSRFGFENVVHVALLPTKYLLNTGSCAT
jgi:pimeloyl-ACP methyl ester carboxylesterase